MRVVNHPAWQPRPIAFCSYMVHRNKIGRGRMFWIAKSLLYSYLNTITLRALYLNWLILSNDYVTLHRLLSTWYFLFFHMVKLFIITCIWLLPPFVCYMDAFLTIKFDTYLLPYIEQLLITNSSLFFNANPSYRPGSGGLPQGRRRRLIDQLDYVQQLRLIWKLGKGHGKVNDYQLSLFPNLHWSVRVRLVVVAILSDWFATIAVIALCKLGLLPSKRLSVYLH